MSAAIRICCAPPSLPGERAKLLTTNDWSQVGWASRVADRRGASLWFDGLEATGVKWEINPVRKANIAEDRTILGTRMTAARTRHIVIGNAHLLEVSPRAELIAFAQSLGADLTLVYENGTGRHLHGQGLVDVALENDWEHITFGDRPFTLDGTNITEDGSGEYDYEARTIGQSASDLPVYPATVPTIGFGHFRSYCRRALNASDFAQVDREYRATYGAIVAMPVITEKTVGLSAEQNLAGPTWAQTVTRLRAMQAALFRCGYLWAIDLSTVQHWHSVSQVAEPNFSDLLAIRDPQTAAIAILCSVGYSPGGMKKARFVGTASITTPDVPITLEPDAALILRVAAASTKTGEFTTKSEAGIREDIRFLAEQFGFPLRQIRGGAVRARPTFDSKNIILRPITEATQGAIAS